MKKLKLEKLATFTKAERGRLKALAETLGVSQSYLSQMISGERPFRIDLCPLVEDFTRGVVRRQECRPIDGCAIWGPIKASAPRRRREPAHA